MRWGGRCSQGAVRPLTVAVVLAVAVASGAALTAWMRAGGDRSRASAGATLRLLADDSLTDIRPLLEEFRRQERVNLQVDFVPAAEVSRRVSRADFTATYTGVWSADTGAEQQEPDAGARLASGTIVMSSPLVLGVRAAAVARLTPNGSTPTWTGVAQEAAAGRFDFGMVDPDEDGSALLAIAGGLAGKADTLSTADVFRAAAQLRLLREHQVLRAPNTRALMEDYRSAPTSGRPEVTATTATTGMTATTGVAGIVVHESQVRTFNATADPASRLTVLVPDGRAVFTHYVLRGSVAAGSEATQRLHQLSTYLLTAKAQRWISTQTHRRPSGAGEAALATGFATIRQVDIPTRSEVLDRLVGVYLGTYRYPSRVVLAVDVSGSMRGQGMAELRRVVTSLTGDIAAQRKADVEILLIAFAGTPQPTRRFTVSATDPGPGLASLTDAVTHLQAGGNTAIYRALEQADDAILTRAGDSNTIRSIVLVTDGENTAGPDRVEFLKHRQALRTRYCTDTGHDTCTVPVLPVLVGDGDAEQMRRLATDTTGSVHDARTDDLTHVLQDAAAGY